MRIVMFLIRVKEPVFLVLVVSPHQEASVSDYDTNLYVYFLYLKVILNYPNNYCMNLIL